MTSLCFFHSPCNDGSTAAAALEWRLREAGLLEDGNDLRFCPFTYNTEWDDPLQESYLENEVMPDHPVEEIFIVDISFSKVKFDQIIRHLEEHEKIGEKRPNVVCIDHHKTALDKIAELREFCDETYIKIGPGLSGATLVWNYFNERFNETRPTPAFLKYIADQDIWEWKLPDSHEINAALNVFDGHLESLQEELHWSMENETAWRELRITEGRAIAAMVDSQVRKSAWHAAGVDAGSFTLKVINTPNFSSELGNYICEHAEESPNVVALIYSIQEDWSVRCSLRSIPGTPVFAREVAERYGGGGHDHAAGCRFASFEELRGVLEEIERNGWS